MAIYGHMYTMGIYGHMYTMMGDSCIFFNHFSFRYSPSKQWYIDTVITTLVKVSIMIEQ